jgi:DNA polymerase III subunit chi
MTEVMFHLNVPDRLGYACRLLRKACSVGGRVVVGGPPTALARLDAMLWSFDPIAFVPHVRVVEGVELPARLKATPIWLVEHVDQAPHHDALVNIGDELVPGFESFDKVIELVPMDELPKQAARLRWKHYAQRGYTIKRHEVAA